MKKGGKPLEWDMRLNIAIGSGRGLCYLHHDCIPHIIHRDIKTSNILLDGDMEARVSDFGLAKLITPQQTHVTTMVAGTLGYLPPGESGKRVSALYIHLPFSSALRWLSCFSAVDHVLLVTILCESFLTGNSRPLFLFSEFELVLFPWSRIHGDWENYRERRRVQLWHRSARAPHGEAPDGSFLHGRRFQHGAVGE